MSIKNSIIFSSTLVAILAALAAFMGWKNTQPIQQELVKNLTHTTEEIHFLEDIKTNLIDITAEVTEQIQLLNTKAKPTLVLTTSFSVKFGMI